LEVEREEHERERRGGHVPRAAVDESGTQQRRREPQDFDDESHRRVVELHAGNVQRDPARQEVERPVQRTHAVVQGLTSRVVGDPDHHVALVVPPVEGGEQPVVGRRHEEPDEQCQDREDHERSRSARGRAAGFCRARHEDHTEGGGAIVGGALPAGATLAGSWRESTVARRSFDDEARGRSRAGAICLASNS
jgi:hypothetical protein